MDDASRKLILGASCGIRGEPDRCLQAAPDGALALASHRPERCVILQRPQAPARSRRSATSMGATSSRALRPPRASPWPRPTRCTSSTRRGRRAYRRCGARQTAATPCALKCPWRTSTASARARPTGPRRHRLGRRPLYIVYAPLLKGCTTILYEGKPVGTPDPGAFWRLISHTGSTSLHRADGLRAIKRRIPTAPHRHVRPPKLPHAVPRGRALRSRHPALGERAARRAGDRHWWQTETGWPIAATVWARMLPVKAGPPTKAVPGSSARAQRGNKEMPAGQIGSIAIRLRCRRAAFHALEHDAGYETSYLTKHPGYYLTGDAATRTTTATSTS